MSWVGGLGLEIKDWMTLLGIAVSLLIGARNWFVTNSIRSGTIKIEEFRSQIREPIQEGLAALIGVRESLLALQKPHGLDDNELQDRIATELARFEFALDDLSQALTHADNSQFAKGADWNATFLPTLQHAAGVLGRYTATGSMNRMAAGAAITDVARAVVETQSSLKLRFESEIALLMPGAKRSLAFRRRKKAQP